MLDLSYNVICANYGLVFQDFVALFSQFFPVTWWLYRKKILEKYPAFGADPIVHRILHFFVKYLLRTVIFWIWLSWLFLTNLFHAFYPFEFSKNHVF